MSDAELQGFSLSPQQERLWLLMQSGGEDLFRSEGVVVLEGRLDHAALAGALQDLVRRHEILRTDFRRLGGMVLPLQVIADPDAPPSLQTSLVPLGPDRHALHLGLPALCGDAATLAILMQDLAACYGHRKGGAPPYAEPLQYADLAAWQRDLQEAAAAEKGAAGGRWRTALAGLHLPWEPGAFEPRVEPIDLGAAGERLAALARRFETPTHHLLLACWQVLLARRTGTPRLVLGVSFSGRRYQGLDQAPGLLARYLPAEVQLSGQTFGDLVRELGANLVELEAEQEHFSWLPGAAGEEAGEGFFPFLFDHQELPEPVTVEGLQFRLAERRSCIERYRLRLSCGESPEPYVALHYDAGSVPRAAAAHLAAGFRTLVDAVVADPGGRAAELPTMGAAERHLLLFERNDTAADLGAAAGTGIDQRIAEQALRSPQAPAVVCRDQELTFRELNRRANQLARHLISLGVGPESRVALCLERSLDMTVAALGVLKSGGAYVPLDPSHPAERLEFLLADSAAPVLLTHRRFLGAFALGAARPLCLDADGPSIASEDEGDLEPRAHPDNLAYVIYTSGSTGRPKGVMISHRGLAHYLAWCTETYAVGAHAGAPVHSSFGFDLTVTSLLAPLLAGKTAFLIPEEDGIGGLADLVARRRGLSLLKITPAHLEVLAPLLAPVDLAGRVAAVVVGGEALRAEALALWRNRAPETRIFNEYGPTEAVVGCCLYEVKREDPAAGPVPIGRPVPNTFLYLLDDRLQPVPEGFEGELYIGGETLARGYLSRRDLTADRFLPDPFAPAAGGRMYRTGDLVRRRTDGELEFVGRVDHQVKIRGYRIELGEIESALSAHPLVQEAVVLAREDRPGERRLVAYLLPVAGSDPAPGELREALARKLPEYMVPAAFEIVSGWPLTPNGKLDRRALPPPRENALRRAGSQVAPRNLVEEVLAAIWAEALGVDQVGVDDNFFQLGGDSILTITVLSRAREKGFNLSPQDFFRFPTVGGLAREVLAAGAAAPAPAAVAPFSLIADEDRERLPGELEDAYPLTRLQAGMLFHSEHSRETAIYHDITSFHLRGPLDLPALRAVIEHLVQRHPVLRTSFDTTGFSEPLQLVHRRVRASFRVEDLRHLSPAEQEEELEAWREREKRLPFDRARPGLIRFQVHARAADAFQLTMSYHHAIVDGWSVASMLTEIFQHYTSLLRGEPHLGDPLPEIAYRDFVALELQALASPEQESFWSRRLAGHTFLALPRWGETGAGASTSLDIRLHEVPLPPGLEGALRQLAAAEGLPLKSIVLAAHLKVLGVLGGLEDVLTGLVSHGRPETVGSERIAGLFINSVPLRVGLHAGSWRQLVRRAFEAERDLLPFRRYPLAEIQRRQGGKPLFETLFNFIHFHVYEGVSDLRDLAPVDAVFFEETNFTFTAHLRIEGSSVHLRLDYDANELPPEQIELIGGYYRAVLTAMADDADARHEEAVLLSEPELKQIESASGSVGEVPQRLLHELFAESASRVPEAPAVFFAGGALSYRELARAARLWAGRLRLHGVGTDQVVGVFAERSPESVIAQLAILEAGGAYLALDPAYPKARLELMAASCGVSVLLTQQHLAAEVPIQTAQVLIVDAEEAVASGEGAAAEAPRRVPPGALAYVVFTSGSTGFPKGVGVTHLGLANLMAQQALWLDVRGDSRVLQFASPSFDAAIWELAMTLPAGAALCLPASRAETLPGPDLLRLLSDRQVTHATLPPSVLAALSPVALPDLRTLIAAGEALPAEIARRWAPGRRFFNAYGPSECTVCATIGEVDAGSGRPSIGIPLGNAKVYVLDRQLQPVPVGAAGELHLGGPQLARGYLGRPDLTAARFVPSPFAEVPGARIYATGDAARLRPDGAIDFLGRIDKQVKIRGFRIELGEIEAVLVQHPGVREGAVLAREDQPGERRLVAYLVPELPGSAPGVEELRKFLGERLPEHMLPAAFVSLETLPLTPNGKLDREALPAPEARRANLRTGWLAPLTEAERIIAGIWRDVLKIDRVGLNDNFFDLGGSSLHLLQIQGRLREALGRDVALVDLLTCSTVSALADHLTAAPAAMDRKDAEAPPAPAGEGTSDVAIIAMAGRFPGAGDVEALWRNLMEGVEAITFFSADELVAEGVAAQDLADPSYVRAKGVLAEADGFDADFFGITPREAELTDPQQRVFMECAWAALERAGYLCDREGAKIGVFAGESMNSYLFNLLSRGDLVESIGAFQVVLINDKDFLATRTSYKLGLEGPSLTVQTACSTSLVAVHLACRSLLAGECEIALAGGVSVRVPQTSGYFSLPGGVDSPDGHCRAFDAAAQGTVAGNGVGVVVLKRLDKALEDGDEIIAVLKGSAINNDGSLKAGFTAPRVAGQAGVIRAAHLAAGVDAGSIGYVEAHGTGTPIGDPVEVTALTEAFRATTARSGFCALGSIKANIGHLDAAAGVTGLIKAALALRHETIPPQLHVVQPNPQIDWANSPFHVNSRPIPWPRGDAPRRAGVSSFGIGGTNVHAVLEEAPRREPAPSSGGSRLLVLSARSEAALDRATESLARHLELHPDLDLADVSYTLREGRRSFDHRRMVVCRDLRDAAAALSSPDGRVLSSIEESRRRPVAFLFSGQGAQHAGMAAAVYRTQPGFRSIVDLCAESLTPALGFDLREVLDPRDDQWEEAARRLAETAVAQPALFTVEYALAHLWMSWGVQPGAMLGHSIGEYVAACLAGVMSLEDALALVAERGKLIQGLPRGAMLSVPLPEEEARALGGDLAIAATNAPDLTVLSGPVEEIEALEAVVASRGLVGRRLHTSHAFHSPAVEPILDEFRRRTARVTLSPPSIPFISNLTGTWIEAAEAVDPAYWARHLRGTVRFAAGIEQLLREPDRLLLEVGPGSTLATLARRHPARSPGQVVLASLPHPQEATPADEHLLGAAGRVWLAGHPVHWQAPPGERRLRRVPLPTYPFERRRYWVDAAPESAAAGEEGPRGGREPVERWFYLPSWKRSTPPPLAEEPAGGGREADPWVLLADPDGLGEALARCLESRGRAVLRVRPGSELARLGECSYALPPGDPAAWRGLLSRLREHGRLAGFVHLWSVGADEELPPASSRERGFFGLLHLAAALAVDAVDPVQVLVVASGTQDVTGDEELSPERALLAGPCLVIPQELPHVACRLIDLVGGAGPGAERLAGRLADEVLAASAEPVVAYRGATRWLPVFERVPPAAGGRGLVLRERGVYVILGGLGRIGLAVAGFLARELRARLVLTRRSPLPGGAEGEEGKALVREIEAAGAEVHTASLDVADEAALQALFADTEARWGRVDGVIHAAGVVGEAALQPLESIGEAEAELHFRAKVRGSLALERALAGREPDFCLLFSSLGALLGGLGFAAYAAANAFQDLLARRRSRLGGTPWCSVNWDGWDFSSMQETAAIRPAEAHGALRRLFDIQAASQIVVSTTALADRLARCPAPSTAAHLPARPASAHPRPALSAAFVAPRTELERQIAAIWQDLLGLAEVGIHDNFFELGGHSLLATQLAAKMRGRLRTAVSLRAVFEAPTIAGLAEIAASALAEKDGRTPPMLPVPRGGALPLSFAQQRLWFLNRLEPESSAYNLHAPVSVAGELDVVALERSLDGVLRRHEVLRTWIDSAPDGPVQVIAPELRLALPWIDLTALPPEARQSERQRISRAEARRAFDLARLPLLRACLLRLAPREHSLLLTIHHIIFDAWSFDLFVRDIATFYAAYRRGTVPRLPDLPLQYADFAHWQRSWLQGETLEAELDYWRRQLAGAPPLLPLPLDRPRPPVQSSRGTRLPVDLPREVADGIRGLCSRYEVTPFMALLAAFQVLLRHLTRCDQIVVGTDSAGRDRPEVEGLIGFFVNQLVLRTDLSGDPSFAELLQRVRGVTLGAYEHQDLPFDRLLAALNPERNPGYAPLFQVKLVLLNIPLSGEGPKDLDLSVFEVEAETAQLDLILNLKEMPEGISGTFEYNTDLFNASTIERMARQLEQILRRASERPEILLSDLGAWLSQEDVQSARSASLEGLRRARRREVGGQG